jgi:hypothetical protein
MSEIVKKEFMSSLKWTWVIAVAAIAYNTVAPNYYFMKQGVTHLRGNKVTGTLEEMDEYEWITIPIKQD